MGQPVTERLVGDERGQTLQDYVVGVSIFVVIAFAALGFFPNVLTSFQSDTQEDAIAQSERVANQIITNASTTGTVNELDVEVVEDITQRNESQLRDRYVLGQTADINVTVESLDGDQYVGGETGATNLTTDEPYHGNSAGTTARVVTLSHDPPNCRPGCRLVVRIW